MKVDKSLVLKIAELSKLSVDGGEEKYAKQMEEILGFVGKINSQDLSGVSQTSQITGLVNVCVEDKESKSLSQEQALDQAEKKSNGMVVVPAIFENRDE